MKRFVLGLLVISLAPRFAAAQVCGALPHPGTLTGWWTADSISASSGDPITSWVDSSGSENTATSHGTTPTYQTAVINGRPVMRFGGAGAYDLALPRTTTSFTFLAVVKATALFGNSSILADGQGGRDFYIEPTSGAQVLGKSFTVKIGTSNTGIGTTAFHIVAVTYDSSTATFYLDGAADGTGTSAQTFSHSQTAHLGYSAVPTMQYFVGDIAQAAQWTVALSAADRCAAIRCLGVEYGITVDESSCPATPSPTHTPTGTLTPSPTTTPRSTRTPTPTPLPTFAQPVYLTTFAGGDANHLYLFETRDGKTFTTPAGCSNPIGRFPGPGGVGLSISTLASSLLHYDGKYWVAYELNSLVACENNFGIMNSTDICGPYTWVTDVVAATSGTHSAWNPRWFVDDDGSIHINVNVGVTCSAGGPSQIQPVMLDAKNRALTSWSAPISIPGFEALNMHDTFLISPGNSPNGQYSLWFNDTSTTVGYATSSSRVSGYTIRKSGDWAGWKAKNAGIEGALLLRRTASVWRIYAVISGYAGYAWSDSADNWATWDSGLTGITTSPSIRTGTGSFMVEAPVDTSPANTPTSTRPRPIRSPRQR